MILLPLLTLIFAAGGAWGAVRLALDQKVDKATYITHLQSEALALQSLREVDSLQIIVSRDLTERLREVVCGDRPVRGCR